MWWLFFGFLKRISMFSISWCYLTPSNSRQSNRFLVTVVHQGTCEGDFAEKTPTNQQWGQQTVAEKGNFTQKKSVLSFTSSNMEKTHTCKLQKRKPCKLTETQDALGMPLPPKKDYKNLSSSSQTTSWMDGGSDSSLIEQWKKTLFVSGTLGIKNYPGIYRDSD